MTRRFASATAALTAALLTLALAPAYGMHGAGPEVFPAYHDGGVRHVLMGPSGNSSNRNQFPAGCFGVGPDFTGTARAAQLPLFYALFIPGATQMSCPDGSLTHDMVLSAVPGDAGYNAAVQTVFCGPGPSFSVEDVPFTSAAEVEAAIASGKLACGGGPVLLSPVVG